MTDVRNAHRHNPDGSFDSICIICFATVAHVRHEGSLAEHERTHSCDEAILADRGVPSSIGARTGISLVPDRRTRPAAVAVVFGTRSWMQ